MSPYVVGKRHARRISTTGPLPSATRETIPPTAHPWVARPNELEQRRPASTLRPPNLDRTSRVRADP
jgi:hypothetical protein